MAHNKPPVRIPLSTPSVLRWLDLHGPTCESRREWRSQTLGYHAFICPIKIRKWKNRLVRCFIVKWQKISFTRLNDSKSFLYQRIGVNVDIHIAWYCRWTFSHAIVGLLLLLNLYYWLEIHGFTRQLSSQWRDSFAPLSWHNKCENGTNFHMSHKNSMNKRLWEIDSKTWIAWS